MLPDLFASRTDRQQKSNWRMSGRATREIGAYGTARHSLEIEPLHPGLGLVHRVRRAVWAERGVQLGGIEHRQLLPANTRLAVVKRRLYGEFSSAKL